MTFGTAKASHPMICSICFEVIEKGSEYTYVRQGKVQKGGLMIVHPKCKAGAD